jgi:hypothetical protein
MNKNKHWDWSNFWPALVVGIILLILGGIKLSSDNGTSRDGSTAKSDPNIRTYLIQKKVSSQASEINLYDLKCGTTKYEGYTAKGEFCVASVYIVNRDNTTQDLIPYNWKLYAGEEGFIETSYEGSAFEDILPGQSGIGTIAFDTTKGVVPNSITVFGAETLSEATTITF